MATRTPSTPLVLLAPWAALSLAVAALAGITTPQHHWKTMLSVAAAAWVLLGTLRFLWWHWRTTGSRPTPSTLGMVLAHAGIGVFLTGALLVETLSLQREIALTPGPDTHPWPHHPTL